MWALLHKTIRLEVLESKDLGLWGALKGVHQVFATAPIKRWSSVLPPLGVWWNQWLALWNRMWQRWCASLLKLGNKTNVTSILGSLSRSPKSFALGEFPSRRTLRWLQHRPTPCAASWARTTQLSCSQIPEPQRPYEMMAVYGFSMLSFEVRQPEITNAACELVLPCLPGRLISGLPEP